MTEHFHSDGQQYNPDPDRFPFCNECQSTTEVFHPGTGSDGVPDSHIQVLGLPPKPAKDLADALAKKWEAQS